MPADSKLLVSRSAASHIDTSALILKIPPEKCVPNEEWDKWKKILAVLWSSRLSGWPISGADSSPALLSFTVIRVDVHHNCWGNNAWPRNGKRPPRALQSRRSSPADCCRKDEPCRSQQVDFRVIDTTRQCTPLRNAGGDFLCPFGAADESSQPDGRIHYRAGPWKVLMITLPRSKAI